MNRLPPPTSDPGSSPQPDSSSTEPDSLRSLTRLIVGGVFIGIDNLNSRLRRWEDETTHQAVVASKTSSQEISTPPPTVQQEITGSNSETIRYALVGLAFEAQDAIREGAKALSRAEKKIYHRADPIIKPITSSRLLSPARKRFDRFVDRGQREVDRCVRIGRQEESHSKALTMVAITESVDDVIEDLADNPEIQQLIQTQTTGLVEEIVEEVRERTVSSDIFFEGIVRSVFRKKPRSQLPPPPLAVRQRAKTIRLKTLPIATRGGSRLQ